MNNKLIFFHKIKEPTNDMDHYTIQCHDGNLVMEQDTFEEIRTKIPYFHAIRNFQNSNTIEWLPPVTNESTLLLFSRDQLRRVFALVQFGCIRSLLTPTLFALSDSLGGIECIEQWNWMESERYSLYKEDQMYRDKELELLDAYSTLSASNESIVLNLDLDIRTTYPDYMEMYVTSRTELNRDIFFNLDSLMLQVRNLSVYSLLNSYKKELWLVGDSLMRILNGLLLTEYKLCLTTTKERAELILNELYTTLIVNIRYMIRTKNEVIFYMKQGASYVVSFTLYQDIQHMLLNTGIDVWALATDGDKVVALPRCIRGLIHNCIIVDPRFCSNEYAYHISEMWQKGVHIVCPGYKKEWEKYIQYSETEIELDKYQGLSKIMHAIRNRVRRTHVSVENTISDELKRVHGIEVYQWYQSMTRMESQENLLSQHPVKIPIIVSTYWPDITSNTGTMNNQWAGVCMNRYIPPTNLSTQIEWTESVRMERKDDFYQWLMCYE